MRRIPLRDPLAQSFPQFLGALRTEKQSFQQGAEVKPGASYDNWQVTLRGDFCEFAPRQPRVFAGSHVTGGFHEIEKMVRSAGSLGDRRLRSTNIKRAIDGDRIAVDDFTGELLGKR